ncbi:ComF family protein [Roseateles amylovorans]|uniref:ComF family protein n=1 Tax=Roseateles amylovorans TaxID=2978473 RepID=A0ABY6AY11_9BURK|nr:ComF family protein [Roseateles amylovorans]UXH77680.1 ComF family protein [Roseateles amylovorans]
MAKPLANAIRARWPGECPLCRRWCRDTLCADCRHRFDAPPPARCRTCALRLPTGATIARCGHCLRRPPPLDRCIAAQDYLFPWDRLLQAFKFQERLALAPVLADRLHQALDHEHARDPLRPPDLILPIPLSDSRLRERGYNQSQLIGQTLARRRQCRLCVHSLIRVRDTGHQARLSLAERRGNLRGAFAVVRPVRGLRVAVLDDVMTSGATVFEAAATLRRAGAAEVHAWTVARTPD